jgi:hypothetical protein
MRFSIVTRQPPAGPPMPASARLTIVSGSKPCTVVSDAGSTVSRSTTSTRW